jgi:hypothetical protein
MIVIVLMDSTYVGISVDTALVTLSIEETLLDMGKPVYDNVAKSLYEKYHCNLPDCFKKPEYLKAVLKDLYEESYDEIIHSIKQDLGEFAYKKNMKTFMQVLSQ